MHAAFALLAQVESTQMKFLAVLGIFAATIVLPFMLGHFLARRLRMAGYEWKIGVILTSLALASLILIRVFDPETKRFAVKLGVDLKGGVILIYEVDEDAPPADDQLAGADNFSMSALIEALSRRINPSGTKEIVIRPYGDQQVEIIIPEVDQRAVDQIKKGISTAGVLQFRIVANPRNHESVIGLAREMAQDPLKKRGRLVRDADGETVGLWARVAREQQEVNGIRPFKLPVSTDLLRDASTGEIYEVPPEARGMDPADFAAYVAEQDIRDLDILMAMDDGYDVTGAHLGTVGRGSDELLRPAIMFNLKGDGVSRFAGLTREFAPQGQVENRLGILLDNELLSAPNIQEPIDQGRGRITGQFTQEEVDFLVNILQAGSLPVVLNKVPISENRIDPLLGEATIRQGQVAIVSSLLLVLAFILVYYRFAGMVACMALVANLIFILALMVMIKAALTLPGLAGLVLTVGMSVDANVLIFERIREELQRGSALRMAIRNGFSRATRTIVDANVTTLITAVVLYAIGTDQIRGFAVTLILGILMSMYTAIFCSRVIFEISERSRWISRLNMTQILGATQIDFLGKRWLAGGFSLVVIALGLGGLVLRGADIFDIDFRGGTSVHVMFDEPRPTEDVRRLLVEEFGETTRFTVTAMNSGSSDKSQTIFKVDSSLPEVDQLQASIRDAFGESLATYSLNFRNLHPIAVESPRRDGQPAVDNAAGESAPKAPAEPPSSTDDSSQPESEAAPGEAAGAAESQASSPPAPPQPEPTKQDSPQSDTDPGDASSSEEPADQEPPAGSGSASSLAPSDSLALASEVSQMLAQAGTTADGQAEAENATDDPPATGARANSDASPQDAEEENATPAAEAETQIEVELTFEHAINAETLTGELEDAAAQLDMPMSYFELINPAWNGESSNAYPQWTLRIAATEAQTRELLDFLEAKFAETPVWPSSSKIGSQVAGRMQSKAIAAFGASLIGIIVYIWIRFQRVIYGLAAVVALVHDVLVTLGAIALSAWLAGALGFLLIEEFKISLPIVAALLTIIGYSLNDTIVVFDRIREVRGKSPDLTTAMINQSINQTLSRTLLTSMTTLIVVVILYAIGGEGIHGFAFALVVGVVAGTYSTVFVASPVLLWMAEKRSSSGRKQAAA